MNITPHKKNWQVMPNGETRKTIVVDEPTSPEEFYLMQALSQEAGVVDSRLDEDCMKESFVEVSQDGFLLWLYHFQSEGQMKLSFTYNQPED